MPQLPINGTDLFVAEEGSGEPVVLVHGSLADYRTWLLQLRELSRRYHVIAYSRRYHYPNAEGSNGAPYALSVQAEDLAELIRTRADGRAHVVTSSFGGCVALGLLLQEPGEY